MWGEVSNLNVRNLTILKQENVVKKLISPINTYPQTVISVETREGFSTQTLFFKFLSRG